MAAGSKMRSLLARQARRHLELPFGDQQLAVVVKGETRRFGPVIPIETGLDQTIEIPNGLDIDRQGDQL